MVVLSTAVVTAGKTLLARQFVEMSRLRVEGLLSAFHKLLDVGRDHTFIETETVRYVYQPMESLHLLVVTNKSSNILEDLETLRLLATIVQDRCQATVSEEAVLKHALDIVLAFDEAVSLGHRQSVTLSQVKSFTEMDSQEEKHHHIIEKSKMDEAREMAKKKQKELERRAWEAKSNPDALLMTSISSSDSFRSPQVGVPSCAESTSASGDECDVGAGVIGPFARSPVAQETPAKWTPSMNSSLGAIIEPKVVPKKGMVLKKTSPGDVFASLGASDPALAQEVAAEPQPAALVVNPLLESVKVVIQEKVTADLEVEGGLNGEATCHGSLEVSVLDASKADLACFKLAPQCRDFKYKVHPSLDKSSHANNILEVRRGQSSFPTGGCLKWQLKTSDDNFLPVMMSCWPTAAGGGTQIVLELELTDSNASLENVLIRFPASASSRPAIASASPGDARYEDGQVAWHIPVFGSGEGSGMLDFSVSSDAASLLPAKFEATQTGTTRCPMEILECYHQARKDAIDFACEKKVTYELSIGS